MFVYDSMYYQGLLIFHDDKETVSLKVLDRKGGVVKWYWIQDKSRYRFMLGMLQDEEPVHYRCVILNDVFTYSEWVKEGHLKRERKAKERLIRETQEEYSRIINGIG